MLLLEIQDFDYSFWNRFDNIYYRKIYCSENLMIKESCKIATNEYLFYYIVPEFKLLSLDWKLSDLDYSYVYDIKPLESKKISLNYIEACSFNIIKISILGRERLRTDYDLLMKIKRVTDQHNQKLSNQLLMLKNLPWSLTNTINFNNRIRKDYLDLGSEIDNFNMFL